MWRYLEEAIGVALLVAACLVAMGQVVSRYVAQAPLPWTEELSTILLVWLSMIGAVVAMKRGDHFAIDLLQSLLPGKGRKALAMLNEVMMFGFSLLLIWFGFLLVRRGAMSTTATLGISRALPYAAIPVAGLLMAVRGCERFIRLMRGREPGGEAA